MLAIRLRRTGSTKRPYYRVVVADSRDVARRSFHRGARPLRPAQEPGGGQDRHGSGEALDRQGRQGLGHRPQPAQAVERPPRRLRVRPLLLQLARGLVREPGRVRVHEHVDGDRTILELEVSPADLGSRDRARGAHGRARCACWWARSRGAAARTSCWRSSTDARLRRTWCWWAGWSSRRAATARWPCCPSPTARTAFRGSSARSFPRRGRARAR